MPTQHGNAPHQPPKNIPHCCGMHHIRTERSATSFSSRAGAPDARFTFIPVAVIIWIQLWLSLVYSLNGVCFASRPWKHCVCWKHACRLDQWGLLLEVSPCCLFIVHSLHPFVIHARVFVCILSLHNNQCVLWVNVHTNKTVAKTVVRTVGQHQNWQQDCSTTHWLWHITTCANVQFMHVPVWLWQAFKATLLQAHWWTLQHWCVPVLVCSAWQLHENTDNDFAVADTSKWRVQTHSLVSKRMVKDCDSETDTSESAWTFQTQIVFSGFAKVLNSQMAQSSKA